MQALADRLAGRQGTCTIDQFDGWTRRCWQALDTCSPGGEIQALQQALSDHPDAEDFLHELLQYKPGKNRSAEGLSTLEELGKTLKPITWVWKNWVLRGLLSMVGAVSGVGKSFFALDLARSIIMRQPFPDGQQPDPDRATRVLYVDAEMVPQILYQRARAWELDLAKLYVLLPEESAILDLDKPAGRSRLTNAIEASEPELVIIDSLSAITSKGENYAEDVSDRMMFLRELARKYDIGLLLVHHLRKTSSLVTRSWIVTLDDFRGSTNIVNHTRSVMALSQVPVGPEADPNSPRLLAIVKSNVAPHTKPLGFEFTQLASGEAMLKWGEAPEPYKEPTQLDRCKEWLKQLLISEMFPLKPAEIIQRAAEESFSASLVYRARRELSGVIHNTRGHKDPDNCWILVSGD